MPSPSAPISAPRAEAGGKQRRAHRPHADLERADAPFLGDIDDRMIQPDPGISLGIDRGSAGHVAVLVVQSMYRSQR